MSSLPSYDPAFLRSGRFARPGSRIYIPNTASNPNARYRILRALARLRFVYISSLSGFLIYLEIIKKRNRTCVRLCNWRARNDSWGGGGCVCDVYAYMRVRAPGRERGFSQQRERDIEGPSKKKKKSFLRERENFERPCCLCFLCFFLFF